MKTIKEIYKIGKGPSSSHTMGPVKAAKIYMDAHPEAKAFRVVLYGSLAATGKGHLTDVAVIEALQERGPVECRWEPKTFLERHPNAIAIAVAKLEDLPVTINEGSLADSRLEVEDEWVFYSIGGGDIECDRIQRHESPVIYPMTTMTEILNWCNEYGRNFWEYVEMYEDKDIWEYLAKVWKVMREAVERGLETEGVLPGGLHLRRRAASNYIRAKGYKEAMRNRGLVFSYALAVSEENASGGTIVTAPTCGSCGVLPAVLYHLVTGHDFSEARILRALATAGLVGNIVKKNASISGAEVGCQGEVGVACAMTAAAITQLFGGSPNQIEYAAEMGLEHHLGLTCDPVCGLVQVPCIERNAYAAARAMDCNVYASYTDGLHMVSFDQVVAVMKKTGKDLPSLYKETAEGGLAKEISNIPELK